ncbi:MAG: DUF1816 domain-containing protein [Leptolyngbyaceae cyanobacterium SL_7_1]|nr:DUF1816 domain-containing protein [Leptolyngbyaceae cyanobacterium SL_7_1]
MKEIWTDILQTLGQAWWIEVMTEAPRCTYYFGPFSSHEEAQDETAGYLEDLTIEGAQGIKTEIKRCKPGQLTIDEEPLMSKNGVVSSVLNG